MAMSEREAQAVLYDLILEKNQTKKNEVFKIGKHMGILSEHLLQICGMHMQLMRLALVIDHDTVQNALAVCKYISIHIIGGREERTLLRVVQHSPQRLLLPLERFELLDRQIDLCRKGCIFFEPCLKGADIVIGILQPLCIAHDRSTAAVQDQPVDAERQRDDAGKHQIFRKGQIRFRERGSAGGNNGLKSTIQHLGTEDFPRLRLGTGNDELRARIGDVDFVLSKFTPEEHEKLASVLSEIANFVSKY